MRSRVEPKSDYLSLTPFPHGKNNSSLSDLIVMENVFRLLKSQGQSKTKQNTQQTWRFQLYSMVPSNAISASLT